MSGTRVYCVCLAALICQATLIVVSEPACNTAKADQPPGKTNRGNQKPRAQNDAAAPKKESKPVVADTNLLSMEVKALRILRGLEATPHQLSEIARTAKTTVGSPGKREPAKASGAYVELLGQMRHALVADDEDKIEKLRTQFDELEAKNPPDLDDQIEITDGAEIEAVRLLNIFSPQQIVAYAQSLEDEFPDPVQLILEGLQEGRALKKEEWETARHKLAAEVGWLVCGLQGEKASKLEDQVSTYLDQKHAEEGKAGNRVSEIRKLVGSPGPVVVLKNVMEHALAELLSNPQVVRASRDCLRQDRGAVAHNTPADTAADKPVEPALPLPRNAAQRPRRSEAKPVTSTAKRVELDDVLKSPEQYESRELQFDHVTVTGTAPAKLPANLWLAVKTGSGTVVHAAIRGQKLTFIVAKANTPEVIKQMKPDEGRAISVTLICTLRREGQAAHWNARVHSVEVHGDK
jgi:hypothetical protein